MERQTHARTHTSPGRAKPRDNPVPRHTELAPTKPPPSRRRQSEICSHRHNTIRLSFSSKGRSSTTTCSRSTWSGGAGSTSSSRNRARKNPRGRKGGRSMVEEQKGREGLSDRSVFGYPRTSYFQVYAYFRRSECCLLAASVNLANLENLLLLRVHLCAESVWWFSRRGVIDFAAKQLCRANAHGSARCLVVGIASSLAVSKVYIRRQCFAVGFQSHRPVYLPLPTAASTSVQLYHRPVLLPPHTYSRRLPVVFSQPVPARHKPSHSVQHVVVLFEPQKPSPPRAP